MRLLTVLFLIIMTMAVLLPGQVLAHVPPNSVKIPLTKDNPIVEDYECFIHSYVHFLLYKGKYEKTDRRFYLKEFIGSEQQGNRLTINFLVMDKKEKDEFTDSMEIVRDADGVWFFTDEQGKRHQVTTYIHKYYYYYDKYKLMVFSVLGVLAMTGLVLVVHQRRKKQVPQKQMPDE